MKIALILSGIVIVGAVIYFMVNRQAMAANKAGAPVGGGVDPLTGQPWQTVAQAQAQADAHTATQSTTSALA